MKINALHGCWNLPFGSIDSLFDEAELFDDRSVSSNLLFKVSLIGFGILSLLLPVPSFSL